MTPAEAPAGGVGWFQVDTALDAVTRAVQTDEPCFYLGEYNLPSRNGRGRSRFQILRVVRQDALVTAYVHLGPASKFHADQFQMLGGVVENGRGHAVHTVGELQEGADELRARKPRRELPPSDLQGQWRNEMEETHRLVRHQSTFGYQGQNVRP